MKKFLILTYSALILSLPFSAEALTLKSKFVNSKAGDFIVCDQKGSHSLLFVKELDKQRIILEEISFPKRSKPSKPSILEWQEWLNKGAPGHTSWINIEVDLQETQILECFSFSRNAWLSLNTNESFLVRLLDLELHKIPDNELRKIGPPPEKGPDNRKMWLPYLIFDGTKQANRAFDIFRIKWPIDETPLSNKDVEIYFNQNEINFPFPYLVRIRNAKDSSLSFRVLDSGKGLISPKKEMPRRGINFTKVKMQDAENIEFQLSVPKYYKNFSIHAIDPNDPYLGNISLPFEMTRQNESVAFQIDKELLKKKLKSFHSYAFTISAEDPVPTFITSREVFTP